MHNANPTNRPTHKKKPDGVKMVESKRPNEKRRIRINCQANLTSLMIDDGIIITAQVKIEAEIGLWLRARWGLFAVAQIYLINIVVI